MPAILLNEIKYSEGLGPNPNVGFTPIGTIISLMGKTAPSSYLICDGTVYNIKDYPELALYFEEQFGTKNNFGGDGTTTFAVPDLRGEFIRGTGTNSHTDQGNGADVGEHQDATPVPGFVDSAVIYAAKGTNKNYDNSYSVTRNNGSPTGTDNYGSAILTRPTNTSVLFCIAAKNIYIDPKFDYSLEEKVVGTWIDGKPVYQKIISIPHFTANADTWNILLTLTPECTVVRSDGTVYRDDGSWGSNGCFELPFITQSGEYYCICNNWQTNGNVSVYTNVKSGRSYLMRVQYTKTTD